MTVNQTESPPAAGPSTWQWDLWTGLLPAVALMPIMVFQVASLWGKEYLRFFPLAWLLVVGLVIWAWRTSRATLHPPRRWTAIGLFTASALMFIYSAWSFLPWLAHLSAVGFFVAWALGHFGNLHWARLVGWGGLILVTLPLPWGWDLSLMHWLQQLAAWGTVAALDALSIPCIQNGSLVEARGISIVADEVCGGWSSVYTLVAFAAALCLLTHRSFIVSLKVLLLVPMWSLLTNFLRMFTILLVHEQTERDLASGLDYTFLVAGTTILAMLLIWASSRFLTRLYEPIPVADAEFGPIFSGLNKFFCWPQPDPFEDVEPEDEDEKRQFKKLQAAREAARAKWPDFLWTTNPKAKWLVRVVAVLVLLAAIVPIRSLASGGLQNLNFGRPTLTPSQLERLAGPQSLPATVDSRWQLVNFEPVRRNPRSRFGQFGLTWRYASGDQQFDASLDLPFLGWHDPVAERTLQGWSEERTKVINESGWPLCQAELENELGGKAYIFYSLFTQDGQPYTRVPSYLGSADEVVSSGAVNGQPSEAADGTLGDEARQLATAVTYQFQLLHESGVELSRKELANLLDVFLELRQVAVTFPNTPVAPQAAGSLNDEAAASDDASSDVP